MIKGLKGFLVNYSNQINGCMINFGGHFVKMKGLK